MNYKLIAFAEDFVSFLLQNLRNKGDKIKQIILFGSVARGDEGKESDIDLFIDTEDAALEPAVRQISEQFYQSIKLKKYWQLFGVKREINCSVGKIEEWGDLERSLIVDGIILFGRCQWPVFIKLFCLFWVIFCWSWSKSLSVWWVLYGYKQKVKKKKYIKVGMIRECGGEKLGKGIFIVPAERTSKIILFLKKKKFSYKMMPFWQEETIVTVKK